jgi:WXG100 family type VII secretion target
LTYIKVTAEQLQQVSGQLNSTASNISSENAAALSLVNGLVGEGWQGAASTQFDALFTQWKTSADQLLQSLQGISTLLSTAATQYADTEASLQHMMSG